jgi:TrmH family RNA methyltransferase
MAGRYPLIHPWKGVDWTRSVNGTLKEIRRLQRDRRYRDGRGAFFIEGVRNFVQAADHRYDDIVAIIYSEKLLTAPLARKLVRRSRRAGIPTLRTSPEKFRTFSQTQRASGVSAILRQRWTPLEEAGTDVDLCWVILGLVRSAGNLGTLIRTSEAVGGAGFILLDPAVDPFAPPAVRASMGALFRQRFIKTDYQTLQDWLRRNDCCVTGASPDGALNFHHVAYPRPALLLLGEERQGLSAQQRSLCSQLVRIPMVGQADSLNLGVAGSLLMYEVLRANS